MRRRLALLLLSACVLARRYTAVVRPMNWTDAQRFCRASFTDLATILDPASNAAAQQVWWEGRFWIGLYNTSWRWSLGNQDASLNYTNWALNEPGPGSCVTVSDSGLWSVRDCAVQNMFFCYSAATDSQVLVQTRLSWDQAQVRCRSQYTDLSSIQTSADNAQLSGLLLRTSGSRNYGDTKPTPTVEAWTGLSRFFWGWSDSSTFSYSQWGQNQPNGSTGCVTLDTVSGLWFSELCEQNHSFICYTDAALSNVKTVKLWLSGGPADLSDSVLQDSILQQLKQKLQDGGVIGTKLSWRRRPEAEQEEMAPPGGCDLTEDL